MHFKKPKSLKKPKLEPESEARSGVILKNVTIIGVDNTQPGPAIPGYCSTCGALFGATRAVSGGSGARFTLSGVSTNCPNCGEIASLLDGTFEIANNAFSMISGSSSTKEILEAFARLVERAASKEISNQELEERTAELAPNLGSVVKNLTKTRGGMAVLVILILWLKTCHFNVETKFDVNEFWNQLVSARHGLVYVPPKMHGDAQHAK